MTEGAVIKRVNRKDASDYLKEQHGVDRTPKTLAKLAVVGGGPRFRKIGTKTVIYEIPELDRWVEEILGPPLASTSDTCTS